MTCLSHDDAIRVEYPSVADLLDAFAEVIEAGAFERAAEGRIVLADEAERGARAARIHAAALHPALAGTSDITYDPSGWPDHWLRSADLDSRDRVPLGATHTIAEIKRAGIEGPAEGRIAGTVVRLAFLEGGYRVLIDDGTDTLEVWCPFDTTRWRLVQGRRFELAVRLEPTGRSVGELNGHTPVAVATAVRPIDS